MNAILNDWAHLMFNNNKNTSSFLSMSPQTQETTNIPAWDDSGDDIHEHCVYTKNQNKQWYLIGYNNLLKYSKKLKKNRHAPKIISNVG